MKRNDFKISITNQSPSEELPKPLTALWWQKKGDWDKAPAIVQSDKTDDGARVHALLHREEGDLGNASYWYWAGRAWWNKMEQVRRWFLYPKFH